jgi:glutamine synthetase
MNERERSERASRAGRIAAGLTADGVRAVAVTWVDNAGLTRVKAVPTAMLGRAAAWGVGASPAFDVFVVDDSMTASRLVGGPGGDLRLLPDLDRLVGLAAQPGWAWAPADRVTQDDEAYPACQRGFAARMVEAARARGLTFRMAFEVEWFVGPDRAGGGEPDARPPDDDTVPACRGPAYGMTRLVELSDYAAHILSALGQQDVAVEQFHPEYAPGQFEVSVAAADPVSAADDAVLVRQTIQAVSRRHGLRASFAPVVVAGQVGNGGHLHLSAWDGPRNLFAGGSGPYGLTGRGESMLAGLLDALPALSAVGSPSVASYLRLLPSRWAGAYACWGRENREAALRFITGTIGSESSAANAELKSFDLSANPYLVVGAVIAVGLAGVDARRQLPPEVTGDPARKPAAELDSLGVRRLPQSLPEAISHLEGSDDLRAAMGDALFESFLAVRRAEVGLFADRTPEEIAAATRWRF